MTTVVQEVRPLTAQEAHELVKDQRQKDIKLALRPGKWWRFGGWFFSFLFLITCIIVFTLSNTYFEWWHTTSFVFRWLSNIAITLILLTPALLALVCFGMSQSVTIATRTEFFELNLTTVVETAIYRYLTGTKDDFINNKGCLSLALALKKEEDEATAILGQVEQLLEEILYYLDANGGLVRLSEKREILSAASKIIDYLAEQKMSEPAPSEVSQEVHDLQERLRNMITANQMPA